MSAFRNGARGGEEEVRHHSPESDPEKPPRPSVPQTLAGTLTAISVTYFMSFLGVAGTVIGVGLVSILTVLGNFMYSSAIYSARVKVKRAQPMAKRRGPRPEVLPARMSREAHTSDARAETEDDTTESFGSGGGDSEAAASMRHEPAPDHPESPAHASPGGVREAWKTMMDRYGPKKIFGSIALVFVLLAGTVTVIELSVGQPLSDIVRNEDSSGTTFFGGAGSPGGEAEEPTVEDDDPGDLPPAEQELIEEDAPVPEAPQEEDPAPVEEPQHEEQPAPQEEAPEE